MSLRDHIAKHLSTRNPCTAKDMASAFFVSADNVYSTMRHMQADAEPFAKRPRVVGRHGAALLWGWGVLPDHGTPELEAQLRADIKAIEAGDLTGDLAVDILLEYIR